VTPRRWTGTDSPKARDDLLDAAGQVLAEEGYGAVTARRVAGLAGVNPALVHYYFGTMNGLVLVLFRRGADAYLDRLRAALAGPRPLRALWTISTEAHGMTEFLALANHHEELRAEIAAYAVRVRALQTAALEEIFASRAADPGDFPPAAIMMLIESVSRLLLLDQSLGITAGHEDLTRYVERYLRRFD
jgi:AcrR family transcriptional regulator